jgi:two-component system chemotaxis response regulator CheY
MRFLIVDDSEAPLKHLHKVLKELGHVVVGESHNGEDAVQQFSALRPDAVVMDVIMPRMNGIEALQAIRRINPAAQVVMTCSLRSCETAFLSQRHGAKYFLAKPFQDECLRNVIRKLASASAPCCMADSDRPDLEAAPEIHDPSAPTEVPPPIAAIPHSPPENPSKPRIQ